LGPGCWCGCCTWVWLQDVYGRFGAWALVLLQGVQGAVRHPTYQKCEWDCGRVGKSSVSNLPKANGSVTA